jgi:tripartite-type tricarboxylate transporter receptor subunit TctC
MQGGVKMKRWCKNSVAAIIALLATWVNIAGIKDVAAAEDFPSKPITLIVPWPAGGGSDTIMRIIAEPFSKALGQPVVVVNKPGAGGQIGLRETAEAQPDGYTISFIATGFLAQQYNTPNATAIDDFTFLGWVGTDASALTANASTGWKTLSDFITAAKAKPGTIRNGNDQPGGTSFLGVALMERALGIKLVRIPYAGDAPNVQALLSGEVHTSTAAVTNMIDQHKANTVRILAVSGDSRDAKIPDVPTFKELGYNITAGTIRAVVAPKRLAAERQAKLESAFLTAMNDPKLRERASALSFGISPAGSSAATSKVKALDAELYPILAEADMVKFRKR